jgi:hypothetical protein
MRFDRAFDAIFKLVVGFRKLLSHLTDAAALQRGVAGVLGLRAALLGREAEKQTSSFDRKEPSGEYPARIPRSFDKDHTDRVLICYRNACQQDQAQYGRE